MAARVAITRNTLRAVESGDPGPSIGTYMRVMSILGTVGELAISRMLVRTLVLHA